MAEALPTLTATAPATLTVPSEVVALSVTALPSVPFDFGSVFLTRFSADWISVLVALLTVWSVGLLSLWLPLLSSSWPPLAPAMALLSLIDTVLASKVTAPPWASRSRPVVATAVSFTTVTTIDRPIPVALLSVSPSAAEMTVSFRVAVALKPPVRTIAAPLPSFASVALLAMATATTGVKALEPLAPLLASVVIVWSDVAASVRSDAPIRITPSATRASVAVSA